MDQNVRRSRLCLYGYFEPGAIRFSALGVRFPTQTINARVVFKSNKSQINETYVSA